MRKLLTALAALAAVPAVALAPADIEVTATRHYEVETTLCAASCIRTVLRVWDGDSFLIGPGPGSEAVRIENIDAPEIEGQCDLERELALDAKRGLALLLMLEPVVIHRIGEDRYGRTLARVVAGGLDVGQGLVTAGYVRPWEGRRRPWC